MHWENYISIFFHSERDMIVVTVFDPNGISIWKKSEWNFHGIYIISHSLWKENCHHDHIPFTVKGNGTNGTQCIGFYLWPPGQNDTERLGCLGIIGDQFRASLKPLNTIDCSDARGVSGWPSNGFPWCIERRQSLGQLHDCTPLFLLLFFQTGASSLYMYTYI